MSRSADDEEIIEIVDEAASPHDENAQAPAEAVTTEQAELTQTQHQSATVTELQQAKPDIERVEHDPLEAEVASASRRLKQVKRRAQKRNEQHDAPGSSDAGGAPVAARRVYSSRLYNMLRGRL